MKIHINSIASIDKEQPINIVATDLGGGWKDRDYGHFTIARAIEAIEAIKENQPNAEWLIDDNCPEIVKAAARK